MNLCPLCVVAVRVVIILVMERFVVMLLSQKPWVKWERTEGIGVAIPVDPAPIVPAPNVLRGLLQNN